MSMNNARIVAETWAAVRTTAFDEPAASMKPSDVNTLVFLMQQNIVRKMQLERGWLIDSGFRPEHPAVLVLDAQLRIWESLAASTETWRDELRAAETEHFTYPPKDTNP